MIVREDELKRANSLEPKLFSGLQNIVITFLNWAFVLAGLKLVCLCSCTCVDCVNLKCTHEVQRGISISNTTVRLHHQRARELVYKRD